MSYGPFRPELVDGVVRLKPAFMPAFLAGAKVQVLRQSAISGRLTVRMLERRGVYQVGAEILVSPAEVEPIPEAST